MVDFHLVTWKAHTPSQRWFSNEDGFSNHHCGTLTTSFKETTLHKVDVLGLKTNKLQEGISDIRIEW